MRRFTTALLLLITVWLAGCSEMSPTQQRVLSGGAAGAAGGALIGAIAGNAGMGAAIGGVTGAAGGYVYDYHKRSQQQGIPARVARRVQVSAVVTLNQTTRDSYTSSRVVCHHLRSA